jgi:hypothetical protein
MVSVRETLRTDGVVKLAPGEHPYTSEDVKALAELCPRLQRTDALGDDNRLAVGRIVVDPVDKVREELGQPPLTVDDPNLAQQIVRIAANEKALADWGEALGFAPAKLLRAQTNFLYEGGEVGLHSDHESNPDYSASVIISLDSDYIGGDFVAKVAPDDVRTFRLEAGEVLVLNPDIPHAVSRVESGTRTSLVLFLS